MSETAQLERPWSGDRDAFQQFAETYRHQLEVHCYRMLGSLHEAEDLVQESFLRAWRARDRFEGRTSFKNWLYRIATNACLNTLASRRRASGGRILPDEYGPPVEEPPQGKPATEIAWLQPFPDARLEDIVDDAPGPDVRYELRESVQLAFVAAIQRLPPRQRAVLLLRDVLGWSVGETAILLESSVASVNSALQRARAGVDARLPDGLPSPSDASDEGQRALLDRYVQAWESADIDALVSLLKEDATMSMPPWLQWYRGHHAIRVLFNWVWRRGDYKRQFRLVPTAANGQPAFGQYMLNHDTSTYEPHSLIVLTLQGDEIATITLFRDPTLLAAFGLSA